MKTFSLIAMLIAGFFIGAGVNIIIENNQDRQHLKLIRKGCCQFRVNEYTNEVAHFEDCDNLNH